MREIIRSGRTSAVLGVILLVAGSQTSLAQGSILDVEASASLKSDYVYRGLSRSGGDVTGQAGLDLVHGSGFYLGSFFSTLGDRQGRDIELEAHLGYGFSSGAYDVDLRMSYDRLQGGGNSRGYVDLQASISRDYGLAYLTGGLAISPDKREIGDGWSVYAFGEAEFPLPIQKLLPTSIAFHAGYEDFEGSLKKWDWFAALYTEIEGFELGLGYYDTDRGDIADGGARVVFSIGKYF